MSWKKRCSYKQLFWKLVRGIFSQNPWERSLKKFVFSKVALSHSRKFLPEKEASKFFIRETPQGKRLKITDCQPATLLKMKFFIGIFQGFWLQISEHLFSRTPFKWLLLQRRIQDFLKMELFCEYNERLSQTIFTIFNYFHKKPPS